MVPFLFGGPSFYTSSLDVVRQLLKDEGKSRLVKPRELTAVLLLWGENLVSANGETWKRHRRIVSPAFTTKTYALVWQETISTYREMTAAESWESREEIILSDINHLTRNFALVIISRCGFGLPMPWKKQDDAQGLSFGEVLTIVSDTSIPRLIIPRWTYKLPIKWLRDMEHAWTMLASYMDAIIGTKKEELSEATAFADDKQRGDVFTRLVAALDTDGKYGLDKHEVIGNTFTMMFAGHETTASVLAATLGYLAIHSDQQDKAYQEILDAIPSDRDPVIEDVPNLPHTLACFQESLRLFPAGVMVTRDMTEDTVIKVSHPSEKTMLLRKGSRMIIDMIGVHHDPKVFPEPETYRPSRWYGVSEHEIPMFGIGPRACIGQKFGQTEALCFLSLFLRDWKLDILPEGGESRQQYEERVMGNAGRVGLAFGVGPISLKLTRREQSSN
ncbi:cytochrome P450 [Hygrophoropsis aurantiaca]|uniref:Cytochrome P450 n=1 Tax=Hygrophoropsis aurantiaca TaxID=72124 RepID=A0ACB8A0G1_9AGAM|nr:cytochrome P450 [Hygrophoropsis aurantiaca]